MFGHDNLANQAQLAKSIKKNCAFQYILYQMPNNYTELLQLFLHLFYVFKAPENIIVVKKMSHYQWLLFTHEKEVVRINTIVSNKQHFQHECFSECNPMYDALVIDALHLHILVTFYII